MFTWSPDDKHDIPNCDALNPDDDPRDILKTSQPDWVLYCGPASRSAWHATTSQYLNSETVSDAHYWAVATEEQGARMLMISSDAVFTGPWMFHDEGSPGLLPYT